MKNFFITIFFAGIASLSAQCLSGGSGLVRTPTAILQDDATVVIGSSFLPAVTLPYTGYKRDVQTFAAAVTFLPFMEVSLRLTHQLDLHSRTHTADRMASGKLRLCNENRLRPAVLIGMNDLISTVENNAARHFAATYIVLSKTVPSNLLVLQPSFGYAHKFFPADHYDFTGVFGGLKVFPQKFSWMRFLLEYESERANAGAELQILKSFYADVAWMKLEYFSWGISFAFKLDKVTQLY